MKPEFVEYSEWWEPEGPMIYKRDYLPWNHSQHTYNYIKRTYNVDPEEYGIEKPQNVTEHVCPHCGLPI